MPIGEPLGFAGNCSRLPAISSAACNRASSAGTRCSASVINSNRPVEISAAAIPHCPPTGHAATSQLAERESSSASSVSVPGVISRTTARRNIATGIEGKLFTPLGIAYLTAILASLVVSITVSPVLAYYLMPGAMKGAHGDAGDGKVVDVGNYALIIEIKS